MYYYISVRLYNGLLMLAYVSIFTALPVFSIVFDEDITLDKAIKFPILYKILQKGRVLSTKSFLIWVFKSIYQGFIIMMGCIFIEDHFTNIVTQTFSALIIVEILNAYLVVRYFYNSGK
jgi:phospholipid-translocating ATPase